MKHPKTQMELHSYALHVFKEKTFKKVCLIFTHGMIKRLVEKKIGYDKLQTFRQR